MALSFIAAIVMLWAASGTAAAADATTETAAAESRIKLTHEWLNATMETSPNRSAGPLAERFGLVETGEVCRATADSATLAGSFGCYVVRDDGTQEWVTSTTTFVAASREVFTLDGDVVSFGPAGLFVVGDESITPLDDMAAQTLAGTLPIDAAMPTIAARLDEFDGVLNARDIARSALRVVLPAALAIAGVLVLLATRRRRALRHLTDAESP